MKTPLLDGITKQAIGKPMMLLGGIGIGALGIPALKKKYMGIHPETQQLLEEGDPYYGRPAPISPSRFFRPVR